MQRHFWICFDKVVTDVTCSQPRKAAMINSYCDSDMHPHVFVFFFIDAFGAQDVLLQII